MYRDCPQLSTLRRSHWVTWDEVAIRLSDGTVSTSSLDRLSLGHNVVFAGAGARQR